MTNLIAELVEQRANEVEIMLRIKEQAEKEGIDKMLVRKLIEAALRKRGLNDRRILQLVPADLKNKKMVRANKRNLQHFPAANHDNIIPGHVVTKEEIKALEDRAVAMTPEPAEYPPGEIELDLTKFAFVMFQSSRNGKKMARLRHDGIRVLDVKY